MRLLVSGILEGGGGGGVNVADCGGVDCDPEDPAHIAEDQK